MESEFLPGPKVRFELVVALVATAAMFSTFISWGEESTVTPSFEDSAAIEFFEQSVRPILVERCLSCHGEAKKGGLRLDSRAAVLQGGASGPAVVPGSPEESLLIDAVHHGELVQMPPKSKLPDSEIAILTEWVARGAPWGVAAPIDAATAAGDGDPRAGAAGLPESDFPIPAARWWAFQPLSDPPVPTPTSAEGGWARNPVDRFILARLERLGLKPAPEAEPHTLIRRLSFDLTGLPPTPEEIDRFVSDPGPAAYAALVERLLASPHFGERWGRHWLDLARYAETAGHEFDYDLPNAFLYRDYVIRAFNADLPYDRFVMEHVAGDLLQPPRSRPGRGTNESILGTGFFFLGEGTHSPVDVLEEQLRRIDNQIDVFSKTFLGLTVSCARCHDHKFDPISSADYYALAGFLKSSRHQQAFLDAPEEVDPLISRLYELKNELRKSLADPARRFSASLRQRLGTILGEPDRPPESVPADAAVQRTPSQEKARWLYRRDDPESGKRWRISGPAFAPGPAVAGDFRLEWGADGASLIPARPGQAHSGLVADRLAGVMRSESFVIEHRFLHTRAAGRGGRINVVVEGFEKICDPIYGSLTAAVDGGADPKWVSQDLGLWIGRTAYVELADGAVIDFTGARSRVVDGRGYLAVDEVLLSDHPAPPRPAQTLTTVSWVSLLEELGSEQPELAARIAASLAEYRSIAERIPEPSLAPALLEGTPCDDCIRIRGNPRNPGAVVPRRFLAALGGAGPTAGTSGSGRLELALAMVAPPSRDLLARVMVNRIWKHHFGEGLVKSTDDFGAMGQPPSHPELLDWLASRFVERNWSIKAMCRLLVTSKTYQMTSQLQGEAEGIDPDNVALHRRNVRRLEAEAIRDTLLAVSGRLERTMFGPSVPPHLVPSMQGRGRPERSGPLDGDGRRTIYLNVRRNFLNPMLLAFDLPVPFSTMGRRNVSNVPAQALTLLNDPLVSHLSRLWARRLLFEECSPTASARIQRLFLTALGRPPTDQEIQECLEFLETERSERPGEEAECWAALCHVILNAKEFIYLD